MNTLRQWIKVFFTHPMILYFFILPVYLPIRMLSEDVSRYHHIMPSAFMRVDYFIYVFAQVAISGLLLALGSRWVNRIVSKSDVTFISVQRSVGMLVSVAFIFSTYCLLSPVSYNEMFFASGLHYFCIAFFANLVILETKHYVLPVRSENLARLINNTVFGINLNLLGMVSFIIMNAFMIFASIPVYAHFCVLLECAFFAYLLLIRRYGFYLLNLLRSHKAIFFRSLAGYGLMLLLGVLLSFIASLSVFVICVFIPFILGFAYYLFKHFERSNIQAIFTGNVAYGVLVVSISTPIIMLLFDKSAAYTQLYSRLSTFEPMISGLFVVLILCLILKGMITSETRSTYHCLYRGASIVVLLPIMAWLLLHHASWLWMLCLFLVYSSTESFTQYGVREIILKSNTDFEATLLNYYARMIWQGFVPAVYILVLAILSRLFSLGDALFFALSIMAIFSLGLTFVARRFW